MLQWSSSSNNVVVTIRRLAVCQICCCYDQSSRDAKLSLGYISGYIWPCFRLHWDQIWGYIWATLRLHFDYILGQLGSHLDELVCENLEISGVPWRIYLISSPSFQRGPSYEHFKMDSKEIEKKHQHIRCLFYHQVNLRHKLEFMSGFRRRVGWYFVLLYFCFALTTFWAGTLYYCIFVFLLCFNNFLGWYFVLLYFCIFVLL